MIFGIAAGTQLLPQDTILMLTAVISISMAMSPILNIINDQINVRMCKNQAQPQYDVITNESPEVIIAGTWTCRANFCSSSSCSANSFCGR